MHLLDFIALVPPDPPKAYFNLPAFIVCMVIVVLVIWMAFRWIKKPETRTRGLILMAIIVIPTVISGLGILLRVIL